MKSKREESKRALQENKVASIKRDNKERIDQKKAKIESRKKIQTEQYNKMMAAKEKELQIAENPNDFTQITVINKNDIMKDVKNSNDEENEIVLDNIETKFLKKELKGKREEEIEKENFHILIKKFKKKLLVKIKQNNSLTKLLLKKLFKKKK